MYGATMMDTSTKTNQPFTFVEEPNALLPALITGDWLSITGTDFHPVPHQGPATSHKLGISGYACPYLKEGQHFYSPPAIWFCLLGPPLTFKNFNILKDVADDFGILINDEEENTVTRIEHVCGDISVHRTHYKNKTLEDLNTQWRQCLTAHFIDLAGIDVPHIAMIDGDQFTPFTWVEPIHNNLEIPAG